MPLTPRVSIRVKGTVPPEAPSLLRVSGGTVVTPTFIWCLAGQEGIEPVFWSFGGSIVPCTPAYCQRRC